MSPIPYRQKNNVTLAKDVYLQQENGDLYHGLTGNSPLTGWYLRMGWK